MKTETGGPAFPAVEHHAGYGQMMAVGGMTLRDYFAAQAMQGDLTGGVHHDNFDITAKRAYIMADAMLKERGAT